MQLRKDYRIRRYQKAKQGKFPSGGNDIPYGYELDEEDRLIINQEEARVIRIIFERSSKWIRTYILTMRKGSPRPLILSPAKLKRFVFLQSFWVNFITGLGKVLGYLVFVP